MSPHERDLLSDLLRDVSRSFYLTVRALPKRIRAQIGLAYLLARAADTIADTEIIPVSERLVALRNLRDAILSPNSTSPGMAKELAPFLSPQEKSAESVLLERINEALSLLADFEEADQRRIREVLEIITSGQELDLRHFGSPTNLTIGSLRNDEELDDYTYRVAGCVGEFWTKMCRAHLFPGTNIDEPILLRDGVRFGKGLQMVNILRDLPADLQKGRCYIPINRLREHGLSPGDLRQTSAWPQFRPLYLEYIASTRSHLAAGWDYTNTLPFRCVRVRLACAWPILIAARTLAALRETNVLDAEQRVKVGRAEVRGFIRQTVVWYCVPAIWRGLLERADGRYA